MGKLIRNGIEYGGGNGTDIFKVTQAEYDALVQAGMLVHNALYVISDAPNLNATASDIEYSSGVTVKQAIDSKADTSSLSTVATSGDFNDLLNKPLTFGGVLTDLNNVSRTTLSFTLYAFNGGATNSPSGSAGGWLLSMINDNTTNYGSQIASTNGGLFFRKLVGGTFQAWSTLAT